MGRPISEGRPGGGLESVAVAPDGMRANTLNSQTWPVTVCTALHLENNFYVLTTTESKNLLNRYYMKTQKNDSC